MIGSDSWANYLVFQIQPICGNIDEMILRLEEFESLLNMLKNDTRETRQFPSQLLGFREEFKEICQRVDSFQDLLKIIHQNLTNLERQVETAAEELGYSETGLRGLLKPLFKAPKKVGEVPATNLDGQGNFVPVEIFRAADYFPDSSSC